MTVQASAHTLQDELVALRRSIHADPEIGLYLPRTQARILEALAGLPLEISTGTALSSVVAVLRGGRPGPAVLLRGDMDALPVTESADVPYASEVPGVMHACGHDLHVAMLVGAARLLCAARERLAGDVIFMFQPGEEGPGGAEPMISEGLLAVAGAPPVAAYGLHVSSSTDPYGMVSTRRGPLMAAADAVRVTVTGKGGHGSEPFRTRDPIPATCEMVLALQTAVTRSFDIFDPIVLTIGSLHAGTAENIIPETAHFEATIRSFSTAARDKAHARFAEVLHGIAAAHGLRVDIEREPGYPVTANDGAEAEFAMAVAADLFGADRTHWMDNPIPGGEDFSFVLERVPGAFLFLGACPPGTDPETAPDNHAPEAVFDDGVLSDGAHLLAELALRRLAAGDAARPAGVL